MKPNRLALACCAALALLPACDSEDGGPTPVEAELSRVTEATRPLRDFSAAVAAGYSVQATDYFPHMGIHYLNPDLLDDRFEVERPEILVFVPTDAGGMDLVAVEYATPIADLGSPPPAPAGFAGTSDVWAVNEEFSLWTLHAWVWMENPDGVFASHNHMLP